DRDLQRMRRADGQEVVNLTDPGGQRGWSDEPADTPSSHRIGFAGAADRDRSVGHAWKGGDAEVAAAINEVLIDLVGDRNRIVIDAELRDQPELRMRIHLAGRVVRRVDHDRPGPLVERLPQL